MAEVLVSAVVTVLVDKLYSRALMNFAQSQGIDSQLNEWKKTLPMIQAVLADAAQKQITQKPIELWLIDIQDLAYDIEDVLDDIATEVMKSDFKKSQANASTSGKLFKMLPTCCTNYTPHNIMYGRKMSSKIDKITSKMHNLFKLKNDLGLVDNRKVDRSNNKTDVRFNQTSLIDESKVLGREDDKAALLEKLLGGEEACSNRNVSIVSIVGMGGIGKTTLTCLLYNDQKVKDHFELRAWVCVSDDFDVFNITKQIYQAVGGENKKFTNLELLQVALKEELSKKRFLLVLDDVWNEDHQKWELLERPLVGARGSKVIVTTRKTKVVSVINSVQRHNVGVLSDEIALSLFARYALDEQNFDKHPSLKSIAQGIIKKCDGLPLALITLGRVLKTKGSADEWTELLNSEIWNLQDESDILPALKLSYYDLPSHLKQLFAYCSLFPKDYVFEKNRLVLLWMAQGFLSQTKGNNQPMESLGRKHFEELLSRSFFQPVANDESLYTMHDLMNDLAISVAGEFFILVDDKKDLNGRNEDSEKFRHFSFISQDGVAEYRKFKELHRARCLRTFLPVSVGWWNFGKMDNVIAGLLPHLHFLRVLSLTDYSITKVPQSIGNLKHLRYLNVSCTGIVRIPEQVGQLYNLQSLLIRECRELCSLPVSFVKLINLRHLDMTDTPSLKKLPLGIGGLMSLQTLSKVIIEGGNGFKVSELKGLMDLKGALSIEGLDKVIDPTQANEANLQQKKGLDDLGMKWSDVFDDSRDPVIEYEVLEKLRPHSKLKILRISGYGGMKFPSWLGNPTAFDQLTELELRGCENCTELPTLGHLTSLQKLFVYGCEKLESIKEGEKEVVNVGSSIMGSLRHVTLVGCHSLESYSCPNNVERLEIVGCDSMTSLTFSKLQEEPPSSSLKSLHVVCCKNIKSISQEHLQSLASLEDMCVLDCPSMEDSFPSCGWLWPPNLRKLTIGGLKKPMSEWGFQNYPPSLVELELYGRDSGVVSFGIMEEQEDHNNTTCFLLPPSLTELYIYYFEEVESVSEVLQHLPHLQRLEIWDCPKLRDVPDTTSSLRVLVAN